MTINPDGRRQSLGALSGSREPDPRCTGSGPSGFDPERLGDLINRCELAMTPDRKLFINAYETIHGTEHIDYSRWGRFEQLLNAEAWLDAALTLVPEGLHLAQFGEARFMTRSPCFSASIEQWVDEHLEARTPFRCHGVALTPALALCAAALRAIRIEAGTGGTTEIGPTRSARAGAEGIARNTP